MADTYVLIHGAWHDGSGWSDVAERIRAEGHTVHTPTLAGNGHGDDIDRTIGHETATASAVAYIEEADHGPQSRSLRREPPQSCRHLNRA